MISEKLGVRYPTFGFLTGGAGAFDDGIPPQPYETFAYDLALYQAGIENFNIIPYTSVLPPEMRGNIVTITKEMNQRFSDLPYRPDLKGKFHHGAVLEVIMAGSGATYPEHKAIATGVGIVWAKKDGVFVGGFAAEYVQFYDAVIDDEIAAAEAGLWLNKSLNHELSMRGMDAEGERELFYNYINIPSDNPFGYCLTAIGFLNFSYAPVVS